MAPGFERTQQQQIGAQLRAGWTDQWPWMQGVAAVTIHAVTLVATERAGCGALVYGAGGGSHRESRGSLRPCTFHHLAYHL